MSMKDHKSPISFLQSNYSCCNCNVDIPWPDIQRRPTDGVRCTLTWDPNTPSSMFQAFAQSALQEPLLLLHMQKSSWILSFPTYRYMIGTSLETMWAVAYSSTITSLQVARILQSIFGVTYPSAWLCGKVVTNVVLQLATIFSANLSRPFLSVVYRHEKFERKRVCICCLRKSYFL